MSEPQGLPPRIAAFHLLDHVLQRKQTLDSGLERTKTYTDLNKKDRALCRMIVGTTLRRLGQIDDLIDRALDRTGSDSMQLRHILRIGAVQCVFMDVPDHAAVDTAVELAKTMRFGRQASFVNGVLRTITRNHKEWLNTQAPARLNTPAWVLQRWIADYGMTTAAQIAAAHLNTAPLDITFKTHALRMAYQDDFDGVNLGRTTRRITPAHVPDLHGYDRGDWWVQDAAAAIPATLFGEITGQTVVDFCAAPGGKTMQLAAQGAHVIALDRSAARMRVLQDNLKRTQMTDHVTCDIKDALSWTPAEPPQYILLDAPCSATGTIRRHPDLPYIKEEKDIDRLCDIQTRLLNHAFNMLAPEGTLIYCVCSIQKCEGEGQITRLLANHRNASKLAITESEASDFKDSLTENGDMRILPTHLSDKGGMDGFFISRIAKH